MLSSIVTPTALAATFAMGGGTWVDRRAAIREASFEAAFPPQGLFLDVDDVPVHAVVRGEGPDLVFLHGASGNARDWSFSFMDRLADRFRVIAFDRPGLGYTGRTDPDYDAPFSTAAESPREQAILLQAAAAQLGAHDPVVIGHSFGGAIALAWAVHRPGTLRALTLVAAASNRWEGGLGPLYAVNASAPGGATVIPFLTAFVGQDYLRRVTEAIFAPDPVPQGYFDHVGAPLTLRRRSLRANARQVNGLKPHIVEMEPHYPALDLPIEVVHGTRDTIVPDHIHALPFAEMVPHANLTRLDGVGHMPHHVAPDEVEAAILRAYMA
ncbi:alpha/beta fold hydrolase [Jannaschia aquimarina]|uniref:Lip1 protein n=1 Tax=Jannaschia aquimarina TaxID=935700 RepID=A0A0D1EJE6_9RHOB|nr:alpha/beta hydrolase [Jannaschia aquimarina]KIT15925.1 Lipase 1 precursor [Jannaschia aquimarina]SNS97946.1 Pimeloyl-ACP methyl ester carboxylesterase [Jannaschia aquimarina]